MALSRQFDYDPRKYVGPEERGPRWRNKERGPRLPGDMGPEVRRVMVRRNGVRFQVTTVCQLSGSLFKPLEKKSSVLKTKYSSAAFWTTS
ncbi:hypothetical protein TNCV_4705171 [Trichonephila clavipes]|nr:hypothetical protein TNCV_4705171 [Trichonephila clavipes]